jgi:Rieske Fe-S protein
MNRKEFITTCSYSCLGMLGVSVFLESCKSAKHVQVTNENMQLKVARSEFVTGNNSKLRRHLIIQASGVGHPIVLYRFSDTDFSALLLECTHQGTELNVNGDLLSCSAHGSEFSNRGEVIQGPADQRLKSYKVTNDKENIYIHLA